MTVRPAAAGGSRNGLPEFRPYRYGGTGADVLERPQPERLHPEHAEAVAGMDALTTTVPAVRCKKCGYLTSAAGHRIACGEN
jgi:hypothetical protein